MWWIPFIGAGVGALSSLLGYGIKKYGLSQLPSPPKVNQQPIISAQNRLEYQAQKWEGLQPSQNLGLALGRQVSQTERNVFQQARSMAQEQARRTGVSPRSQYARALQNKLMQEALGKAIQARSAGYQQLAQMKEQYRLQGKERAQQLRNQQTQLATQLWLANEQRKMQTWKANVERKLMEYQALVNALQATGQAIGGALNTYFWATNLPNSQEQEENILPLTSIAQQQMLMGYNPVSGNYMNYVVPPPR